MDEGEQYIQDFFGKARFFDLNAQIYRVAELTIHFCSRSIILEFTKDPSLPLYKYHIRYMTTQPQFDVNFNRSDPQVLPFLIRADRVIEVPINSKIPRPYVIHNSKDFTENLQELQGKQAFDLRINIEFHDVAEFFNALRDIYMLYQQRSSSYEDNLEELIFKHYIFAKHAINQQFNKTWLKKLSEKCVIPGGRELKIKYILPLVSVDGLLYISDERVYMQPIHPYVLG